MSERHEQPELPQPEPPTVNQGNVAAYGATIAHHASVVAKFSSSFVNAFAIFNAGAFSASMAILATKYGDAVIKENIKLYMAILTSFAAGFAGSCWLMVTIFQYSLNRYQQYREILAQGVQFSAMPPTGRSPMTFVRAYLLLSLTLIATFVGLFLILLLLVNLPNQ